MVHVHFNILKETNIWITKYVLLFFPNSNQMQLFFTIQRVSVPQMGMRALTYVLKMPVMVIIHTGNGIIHTQYPESIMQAKPITDLHWKEEKYFTESREEVLKNWRRILFAIHSDFFRLKIHQPHHLLG